MPGPSPCTVRRHASEHRDARTALHVLAALCALTVRASLCLLLPFVKPTAVRAAGFTKAFTKSHDLVTELTAQQEK